MNCWSGEQKNKRRHWRLSFQRVEALAGGVPCGRRVVKRGCRGIDGGAPCGLPARRWLLRSRRRCCRLLAGSARALLRLRPIASRQRRGHTELRERRGRHNGRLPPSGPYASRAPHLGWGGVSVLHQCSHWRACPACATKGLEAPNKERRGGVNVHNVNQRAPKGSTLASKRCRFIKLLLWRPLRSGMSWMGRRAGRDPSPSPRGNS